MVSSRQTAYSLPLQYKWKQKGFSGADRDVIQRGADMLGVELSELIEDVIMGMRKVAAEIVL